MHELSVCQALVEQLVGLAREHGASRVERVELRVGPLAGIEPALLETAYPIAAAGTPAEGAVLELTLTTALVRCRACGFEGEAAPNRLVCARCGDFRTDLASGDELLLARVELSGLAAETA
jgi:hydrogenase nickel incorporation protein HypA/HybF